MPDKTLKCVACHQEFPFTEGEQEFYAARQYTDPKRCKPCRDERKAQKDGAAVAHAQAYPEADETRPQRRRR
jgi:hypothetical protein